MATPLSTPHPQRVKNHLEELHDYGQSVWYDNISRDLIKQGGLQKLIDESGVRGVTSNPTIFAKATAESKMYDDEIREGIDKGLDAEQIFENLAVADIGAAADIFRPLYDQSKGIDGYVSIEVSPTLAHNTETTETVARRLWTEINRPNVMIKVPATPEGLPAITTLIGEGINVNVTLIFGLERYKQVIDAYLAGLDRLIAAGRPLDKVASVASFFVSRVDTLVDKELDAKIKATSGAEAEHLKSLLGKAAIANAKLAYELFLQIFHGKRFETYRAHQAQVQRPLWASTSTKNPNYRDVIYVEQLVGMETVDTMPPATIVAFGEHGEVCETVTQNVKQAHDAFQQLAEVGIHMDRVGQQLEDEGVTSFGNSFKELLQTIDGKRQVVAAAS
ncbi:MAG: transaldolase [Herpetosiphonaceae bacterium]|nr:transaldolase [Herpetosiphonaceae bacterium]